MKTQFRWMAAVAVAVVVSTSVGVRAGEPVATTITVSDAHCEGCMKKVGTQIGTLTGIAKIEYDVEAKTVKVTPKPNVLLSPKALWEAVEKAKKTPMKLEGPSGAFTTKPKS